MFVLYDQMPMHYLPSSHQGEDLGQEKTS